MIQVCNASCEDIMHRTRFRYCNNNFGDEPFLSTNKGKNEDHVRSIFWEYR